MKNEYRHNENETTTIFLNKGLETIISTSDFEKVDKFPAKWTAIIHKQTNQFRVYGGIYLKGNKKENHYLHRWIMEPEKEKFVDHINHNMLDNRRENLRDVTPAQNQQNKSGLQPNNKTGYRNVSFDKRSNKYRAYIQINRKQKHLGYFETTEEAHQVAIKARKEYMPFSND